ncbi:MAG: DUF1259 domain-containing protein [Betaproteobacteria bacterium]|jgi:phosphotransferase system IIB component
MNWYLRILRVVLCGLAFWVASVAQAADAALDTARIEQLTGLNGTLNQQEGVFKVNFPRKDIQASVAGSRLIPDQGLTAWAAFTRVGDHTMVMGDIVVLENEVNPVMSAALDSGLEVTALHNHFMWDSPKVMFMHIGGMGDEAELARAVGRVFGKLKELISTRPTALTVNIDPAKTTFDPEDIEQIVGIAGVMKNGIYKIVVGRTARMGGREVGKEMGVNSWAAFAGSEQQAVVDGDFAMQESEVQDVLKTMRAANINIVSIHNHMIGESPRYVFLHYWGVGPVEDLARGLKAALAKQSGK